MSPNLARMSQNDNTKNTKKEIAGNKCRRRYRKASARSLSSYEEKIYFSVENNPKGICQAMGRLAPYRIGRIVVGATGRYEHDFVEAALDKGLPVIIANPLQVRRHAGAVGLLAKTDKIDSALIAEYAATIKPQIRKHKNKIILKIKYLLTRRHQIIEIRTMEKNRYQIMPTFLKADIKRSFQAFDRHLKKIEMKLKILLEQEEAWHEKKNIMLSMPGVGPYNRDSGRLRGKRRPRCLHSKNGDHFKRHDHRWCLLKGISGDAMICLDY